MATRKKSSSKDSETRQGRTKTADKPAARTKSGARSSTTPRSRPTRVSAPRKSTELAHRRPPEAVELEKSNPASLGARKPENRTKSPAAIVSKSDGALDSYLITLEPTAKAVVELLRELIHEAAPRSSEVIRWRNLCWECDGMLCYASSAKKHVTFGFFRGKELSDPDKILESTKQGEKVVKLRDVGDVNRAQLKAWVKEAVKLNAKR